MKELTSHEIDQVSGAWMGVGRYVAASFGGWVLGDYVFSPLRDRVVEMDRRWTERVINDYRADPHRYTSNPFFYHGY